MDPKPFATDRSGKAVKWKPALIWSGLFLSVLMFIALFFRPAILDLLHLRPGLVLTLVNAILWLLGGLGGLFLAVMALLVLLYFLNERVEKKRLQDQARLEGDARYQTFSTWGAAPGKAAKTTCPDCGGTGHILNTGPGQPRARGSEYGICKRCGGTGKVPG